MKTSKKELKTSTETRARAKTPVGTERTAKP